MSQLLKILETATTQPDILLRIEMSPTANADENLMAGTIRLGDESFPLMVRNFRTSFAMEQTIRESQANSGLPRNMSAYLNNPDQPLSVTIGEETTVISQARQPEAQLLYLLGAEYTRSVP